MAMLWCIGPIYFKAIFNVFIVKIINHDRINISNPIVIWDFNFS